MKYYCIILERSEKHIWINFMIPIIRANSQVSYNGINILLIQKFILLNYIKIKFT